MLCRVNNPDGTSKQQTLCQLNCGNEARAMAWLDSNIAHCCPGPAHRCSLPAGT